MRDIQALASLELFSTERWTTLCLRIETQWMLSCFKRLTWRMRRKQSYIIRSLCSQWWKQISTWANQVQTSKVQESWRYIEYSRTDSRASLCQRSSRCWYNSENERAIQKQRHNSSLQKFSLHSISWRVDSGLGKLRQSRKSALSLQTSHMDWQYPCIQMQRQELQIWAPSFPRWSAESLFRKLQPKINPQVLCQVWTWRNHVDSRRRRRTTIQ